jgi:tRNA A-37 threonylcarbamoyl transferase component Bud32
MQTTRLAVPVDIASTSPTGAPSPPPELLAEASRRLGWAALMYACTYTLAYFGPNLVNWLTVPNFAFFRIQTVFAVASVSVASAVFVLSRRATLAPQRLLDLGLVFEVVGSFGISAVQFWRGFPNFSLVDGRYTGIPWECLWIIIFPLLAPNAPRKVLIASLAAASTGPITVLLASAAGTPLGRSPAQVVSFFLFTTYLCVVVAYIVAHIVYRYGVRLTKARAIGSYELVTKLGEGGMGDVWLGRHRMLARPAAVKLIRPELLGHDLRSRETAVLRFEREATATAALRSTHTIDVYDFGVTEDGAFFYVMEFLEGLSLDSLIKRFGPIGPGRAIQLLRQACHSLGEAHARGLIHRDVKPANIFTCRLGPDCDFVKVLDFGLVKRTGTVQGQPLTLQGVTAGTPAFMPPEIALGEVEVDGRADIYALSCVAYWLLTGQPVFKGESAVATALAHVREAPVPPSLRTEIALPAELDALILDCLAKDPADRPQTMAELDARLEAIDVARWSAEDAKRWWALHGPIGTFSTIAGQDLSAAAVVYAKR